MAVVYLVLQFRYQYCPPAATPTDQLPRPLSSHPQADLCVFGHLFRLGSVLWLLHICLWRPRQDVRPSLQLLRVYSHPRGRRTVYVAWGVPAGQSSPWEPTAPLHCPGWWGRGGGRGSHQICTCIASIIPLSRSLWIVADLIGRCT